MRCTTSRKLCYLLAIVAGMCHADVYVIVNSKNDTVAMSVDQVNRLFLQKSKRFENELPAEPIAQAEGSPARAVFNREVLQRDEQQLKYYWSRRMFSGADKPPRAVPDDAAMLEAVRGNANAIGYVSKAPAGDGIKTVLVVKP